MIRRAIIVCLSLCSVILTLCFAISHWHPFHLSEVRADGATSLTVRGGTAWWSHEQARSRHRSAGTGTTHDYSVPCVMHFSSWDGDGFTQLNLPGLQLNWCRQPSGHRQYSVGVHLFPLAVLGILYPALSVATGAIRRSARRRRGLCVSCGYNLTGNESGRCSECGAEVERA